MAQKQSRAPARDRTQSEQFLTNQKFAYLFKKSGNTATAQLAANQTKTLNVNIDASPDVAVDSQPTPTHSPATLSAKHSSPQVRKSSIQVETTKTKDEQLLAIQKEVEHLAKEVPHFSDIYQSSQQQWASSKRNKADSESFALIQGLTQWILAHGNTAVKQYDEFKQSAESEILGMVHKVEQLTLDNQRLNIMMEEHETEKRELRQEVSQQQIMVHKYEKEKHERSETVQVEQSNQRTVDALETELQQLREKEKAMQEKYERVEKYWKMTQNENDELRNKNYGLEEQITTVQQQMASQHNTFSSMQRKHQETLQSLEMEKTHLQQEMADEQEKLIAAQQQAQKSPVMRMQSSAASPYAIDADDADIGDSGVQDGDGDDFGAIVNLENEINVYEYEDDEWLDDDDDDESDSGYVEPEQLPEPEPEPQPPQYVPEHNKQDEFETQKMAVYQDAATRDLSATFESSRMSFGVDVGSKEAQFSMQSQKIEMEREQKAEPEPFESEKVTINVERRKSLDLQMSTTNMSHTPMMSSPEFKAEKHAVSYGDDSPAAAMEFSSDTTGAIGRSNELIHKDNLPKPLRKVIYIDRGDASTDKTVPMGGKNFADNLAIFQHLEKTKGGKPKVLEESRAYSLINRWQTEHADNQSVRHNPLHNITKSTKNVHVVKSTVPAVNDSQSRAKQINVLKITKTSAHTMKPRLFGYMNVVRSTFVPRWKQTQRPRYFFVLDGLPSQTNINQNEPDFAKNRKHDFLVPTLFFFQDKDEYDEFASKVQGIAVRDAKFQRLFAEYAKGVFALNTYAMDTNPLNCTKRVHRLLKRDNIKLPISEINECGVVNALTVLICNEKEIHRFECNDQQSREKWLRKVNKLVDKRSNRLQNINNGLMGLHQSGIRKSVGNVEEDRDALGTPDTPGSVIGDDTKGATNISLFEPAANGGPHVNQDIVTGRANRPSVYALNKIEAVEEDID